MVTPSLSVNTQAKPAPLRLNLPTIAVAPVEARASLDAAGAATVNATIAAANPPIQ